MGEKLEIAEQLARLGVDVIEAGFPIASQGDFEAVEAIAKAVQGPGDRGPLPHRVQGRRPGWEAVRHAEKPRIHVFIATSAIHMKKKLRMTEDQVKAEAAAGVARAAGYTADVEFSPEDGSRSDFDFMCEVLQIAVDNGATTLNIPDTVGFGVPEEYGKLIRYVIDDVTGDYVVSTHCHDDLGLAVANSLAGVAAGARQVECAINGLGERAGNAALEEIVMAIRTRGDYFGGIDVERAAPRSWPARRGWSPGSPATPCSTTRRSSVATRSPTSRASTSTACSRTARPTRSSTPRRSGQEAAQIVLGKHSGRHAFADTLEKMGLHVQGDALNQAFVRFKELADRKVEITEADLEAIVAEELGTGAVHRFELVDSTCTAAPRRRRRRTVVLDRRRRQGRGRGRPATA